MLNDYKKQLESFLNNRIYLLSLIIIAVLAYGFSAANITVGIDDLECDRYIGEKNELLAAGRFSWLFWTKLFGLKNRYVENNFVFEVAGVICLMWAAINFCILFKKIAENRINDAAYTVFSCVLISYPLMNEIWEYTGVNIVICGGILFASFALLFMKEQLDSKFNIYKYFISSILLMIICAGYESVAVVYVFMVFALLFLQIVFEKKKNNSLQSIIKEGAFYAGALILGVILRVVVHTILLGITGVSLMQNGDTSIWWGKLPIVQVFSDILRGIIKEYFLKGIIYFPITELICSVIIFLIICIVLWKKRICRLYLVPAVGMLVSLILMTLLQGRVSPYRTCQVFAFFVAFVVMLAICLFSGSEKRYVQKVGNLLILFLGVLCVHQAITLNYYFTVNYLRSEEEARVVCDIGDELSSKFDLDKPVIFTGAFELSDDLKKRVKIEKEDIRWVIFSKAYGMFSDKDIYNGEEYRKLPNTNVNSVIEWGMSAFGSQDGLWKLFRYYGFEYIMADYSKKDEAEKFVEENEIPNYPEDGYIYEKEDYIIVNMME